ncbi:MAG: UDP-N-acetyl-D-glucosamine 2-epimerase, UDP-hydrolysing [Chloroflexi bacterium RBG_16_52_11]|nr:MAG: UDP-N-acetyl-D-glucosamine 2-epimerase, UDP-hydrolysing [Chloroflexi bacterium RBG_16_52_11]
MSRKVCVVTGSRAEYGLLRWVMEGVREMPGLELQVIATGMHLSPEFGLTYREIEKDGFRIDRKVEMLLSTDTPSGLAKSMGLGLIGFGDTLQQLQPDMMLVLGDRFEIFSAVAAAMVARIPIAHLHGGEATEGLIDEPIRHSITKMSHLHFTATEEYRKRVIQLGEHPSRVFNVGAPGLDNFDHLELLERQAFEESIGLKLAGRNLLVTFHSVSLEKCTAGEQFANLLAVLDRLDNTHVIFTKPNADTDGRVIIDMIDSYVAAHPKSSVAFTSLGQIRYLSALCFVDAVVGNSSSGLTEAPSFKIGTINIGDRQKGRVRAASVIDCETDSLSISAALDRLYSPHFQERLKDVVNPYGEGGASSRIVEVLKAFPLDGILKKSFYDLAGHA